VADTRKRILVAEDDPSISSLLERVLRAEFDVTVVADGRLALETVENTQPDLLLLDVMMPGLDGLEVARRVRKVPGLKRMPIVFLTAKDSPLDVIQGIQHGARHYITKPFKIDDLLQKVRKALA
jgi:DNA-binding response OmpR family regulator